jgi:hypothetical protein
MLFPSMLLLIVHPTIVLRVCVCPYLSEVYVLTHVLVYVPPCILLLCICPSIYLCMCPLVSFSCVCLSIYLCMCPLVSFCCLCVRPYTCACAHLYPSVVYVSIHTLVYVPTFILLLCKCPSIYCCFVYFASLDFHLFLDLPTHLPGLFSISVVKSCLYLGSYFLCCLFLNVFTSFIVLILISIPYVKREIICSVIDRSSEWIRREVTW